MRQGDHGDFHGDFERALAFATRLHARAIVANLRVMGPALFDRQGPKRLAEVLRRTVGTMKGLAG